MSHLSKLKTKWHYERSVARCELCTNYQKPGFYLISSLPRAVPPRCKAGGFDVRPCRVCDKWQSCAGEVLECLDNA